MSGQLGERMDGTISDDFAEQAREARVNITTILGEAEMTPTTSSAIGRTRSGADGPRLRAHPGPSRRHRSTAQAAVPRFALRRIRSKAC